MSLIVPTSPERVAASRVPVLPNEIFLNIFSYVRASVEMGDAECTHILSQLSLVCHFFSTALRPRLFSRLVLDNPTNSQTRSAAFKFCQALICGDEYAQALAAHIRNCSISDRAYEDSHPGAVAMASMVSHQLLRWLSNVESLALFGSGIVNESWSIIGGLPKLKALEVSNGPLRGDIPAGEMVHIAGLRLSSLNIYRSQVFSFPQLLNTATLSELACDSGHLDTLLARGPISTLETLTIYNFSSMRSLMNILLQVPSVHKLSISDPAMESLEATPRDFAALLPKLHSLRCPLSFLPFLAPRRPLVSLFVIDEESPPKFDMDTSIPGLRGSNITITKLTLPSPISLTIDHFPRLRKLRLLSRYNIDRLMTPGPQANAELTRIIRDICDKWAVIPSVERLYITIAANFPLLDLGLQFTLLSGSLSQKFPALQRFKLGGHAQWERFAADDAWRVLIPTCVQADVLAWFESGHHGVVDHGGCLQQLSARTHQRD